VRGMCACMFVAGGVDNQLLIINFLSLNLCMIKLTMCVVVIFVFCLNYYLLIGTCSWLEF